MGEISCFVFWLSTEAWTVNFQMQKLYCNEDVFVDVFQFVVMEQLGYEILFL